VSADDAALLLTAADRLEALAARTTPGDWRLGGLLATRPEVIAHGAHGGTEHVAEARARTAEWIAALSPAVAPALAGWLRAAAEQEPADPGATGFARVLLRRLGAGEDDETSNV
jgi:hypothetical protein